MHRISRQKIHRYIYLFGLALMITCLPLSLYLTSIAQFILVLNWLAEGKFKSKFLILRQNKAILLFASVFAWYILGFFYSADRITALSHLKNALPLLALPVIIGTSRATGLKNLKRLLLLFCAGVISACIACLVNYLINGLPPGGGYRDISIIMPHLRFSILIVMAIVILANFSMPDGEDNVPSYVKISYLILIGFLIFFLFFLRSATGILIFIACAAAFLVYISSRFSGRKVQTFILLLLAALFIVLTTITAYTWLRNFHTQKNDFSSLDFRTENGNLYVHDTASKLLENGYYTGLYLCETELQQEWDRVSTIGYEGIDLKKQPVKSTLKRYLTSKGLRKDSVSVHLLTHEDIAKIESGLANYKFTNNPGIYQRLYETLYEIHVYQSTGFVEFHSFGQRIAFAGESLKLIGENPLTGIGTGDVYHALHSKVKQDNIDIEGNWKGKPHNQFAFYLIAFGITGLLWILFSWIYPAIKFRAGILFRFFALIVLISMMVMDTLESYYSMAFFALFYSLLVFGKVNNEEII